MRSLAILLDDLPLRENLPADLIVEGGELWQRGIRLIDRSIPGGGRITAGSWLSGRFATKPFVFSGCEWLHVLSGAIVFEIDGHDHKISAGMSALVPRGLSCRWMQPKPVLKYFLRWDYKGDDQATRFWCSDMPEAEMGKGALAVSTTKATCHHAANSATLSVDEGILYWDSEFRARAERVE